MMRDTCTHDGLFQVSFQCRFKRESEKEKVIKKETVFLGIPMGIKKERYPQYFSPFLQLFSFQGFNFSGFVFETAFDCSCFTGFTRMINKKKKDTEFVFSKFTQRMRESVSKRN